jgi:hypothetical protein
VSGREEQDLEDFTAEGLYFDHNMMETFVFTVLMPLKKIERDMSVQAGRKETHQAEEISDLANLSSIIASH